jgi:hypothetical protein
MRQHHIVLTWMELRFRWESLRKYERKLRSKSSKVRSALVNSPARSRRDVAHWLSDLRAISQTFASVANPSDRSV